MTLSAPTLLEGPRGRRLVLEWLAARGEAGPAYQRLREVLFHAAHVQERDRGHSVTAFGPGAERLRSSTTNPDQVAAAIDAIQDAVPPSAGELRSALRASVDAARYWQDRDGDDHVAAAPSVAAALERFAALVASSPHTVDWSAPVSSSTQQSVRWEAEPHGPRVTAVDERRSAEKLAAWRTGTIDSDLRARRERPADPASPFSGAWWSIPPHSLLRSTGCLVDGRPAALEFVEDRFGWSAADVRPVRVPQGLRVIELRTPDDWSALCQAYPLDVSGEKRHDWFQTTGRDERWVIPDWAAIAREADGVHLTIEGYLRCAGVAIDIELSGSLTGHAASVIAGWNPDETWWLTDAVEVVDEPERWVWFDSMGWARAAAPPSP